MRKLKQACNSPDPLSVFSPPPATSVNKFTSKLYFSSSFSYNPLKLSQDQGLDVISEGLDTLKNLARDMNEVCSSSFKFA